MLRLDTRLGPSHGDYDAITPTQARLANDLNLFDTFMPAPPAALTASPEPEEAPIPPPKDSRVFIHPSSGAAPVSQEQPSPSIAAIAPSAGTATSAVQYPTGQISRQNSYTESRAAAPRRSASTASTGSQAQARAQGSASPSTSLNSAGLPLYAQSSYYAYAPSNDASSVSLQPAQHAPSSYAAYSGTAHNAAGHPAAAGLPGPGSYDASAAMQNHASILSATCLPNHLSFAHYQQQLHQQQPLYQPPRTIYTRQPSQVAGHLGLHPAVDAAVQAQYYAAAMNQQAMYAPAYYQHLPQRYASGYASSSASAQSEAGVVASSASSTSSPSASHSTLDDENASTPSSYAGHVQQPTIAGSDLEVEAGMRDATIADPADQEQQKLSVFGKAPKKARRQHSGSSSSGSSGTHQGKKPLSRNNSYSEHDSDSNSGHGHGEKARRFTCPYAGCNKSFTRNFNLSTHYNTHLGIKPFACPHCPKTFSRRHDCARHVAAVHTSTSSTTMTRGSSDDGYGQPPSKRTCGEECGCASGAHSRDVEPARPDLLRPDGHSWDA